MDATPNSPRVAGIGDKESEHSQHRKSHEGVNCFSCLRAVTDSFLQNIISFVTAPRLLVQGENNSVRLSWPSAVAGYQMQWTENLPIGTWQALTNEVQTIGASNIVLDEISTPQRYYRLTK